MGKDFSRFSAVLVDRVLESFADGLLANATHPGVFRYIIPMQV